MNAAVIEAFRRCPRRVRMNAARRAAAVSSIDHYERVGCTRSVAIIYAANAFQCSERSVWRWLELCAGLHARDHVFALVDVRHLQRAAEGAK